MMIESKQSPRGAATREALLTTATQVFARDGFHATSLREIAQLAGVNQALIGYHFGNKEGLYLATFEHLVAQIRQRIEPMAEAIDAVLATSDAPVGKARQDYYLAPLLRLTDVMVALVVHEQSAHWSQMIMREQQNPTAAFSILYDGFMSRLLRLLTALVQRLRPTDSVADVRLLVSTLLGQVLVFRFARAGVMKHLGWESVRDKELLAIQTQVRKNIVALIATGD
ncbi:MAG: CerR family C-terminal domain-containing protein [Proteobacteria bacterium]|nr:CerR family C-terminal domain-containing protein [Pseudomonadota bacterium]